MLDYLMFPSLWVHHLCHHPLVYLIKYFHAFIFAELLKFKRIAKWLRMPKLPVKKQKRLIPITILVWDIYLSNNMRCWWLMPYMICLSEYSILILLSTRHWLFWFLFPDLLSINHTENPYFVYPWSEGSK